MQYAVPRLLAVVFWLVPAVLRAQVDYRNLDVHRPSIVEDAFPIERHAFELSLPYRGETGAGFPAALAPELAWGAFRNGSIGLELEWRAIRSGTTDSRAPRLSSGAFAFVNLTGESPTRPALAVRADLSHPVDRGDAGAASLVLTGLATRSWGLVRAHLNAAWTVASPDDAALGVESRWRAGLAIDRTFFRSSTLFIGEVVAARPLERSVVDWTFGVGARRQVTPVWVLDLGLSWIGGDGGRLGFTAGLSHAFAIAALMPWRAR